MSKQLTHWSVAVMLLGLAASPLAAATTFSARATFDCEIGNDPQIGPGGASNGGTGMGARNIATRRRVSYCAYDITGLRGPGQVFLNVKLDLLGYDPGSVNVYGVLESVEHLVAAGINWNNAPGVKNDPTPALDTDVALDAKDLTPILLTFASPARDVRLTTEISKALTDFLNSDTNGFVALMFAPEGDSKAIIRTIDYGATGGILIQGEVGGQPVAARDSESRRQGHRCLCRGGSELGAGDLCRGARRLLRDVLCRREHGERRPARNRVGQPGSGCEHLRSRRLARIREDLFLARR